MSKGMTRFMTIHQFYCKIKNIIMDIPGGNEVLEHVIARCNI